MDNIEEKMKMVDMNYEIQEQLEKILKCDVEMLWYNFNSNTPDKGFIIRIYNIPFDHNCSYSYCSVQFEPEEDVDYYIKIVQELITTKQMKNYIATNEERYVRSLLPVDVDNICIDEGTLRCTYSDLEFSFKNLVSMNYDAKENILKLVDDEVEVEVAIYIDKHNDEKVIANIQELG